MKENIGIKIVAGFLTIEAILLMLVAIDAFLNFNLSIGFTDAANTGLNPGIIFLGIVICSFSIYTFRVSSGLRRLQRSAYKAAFALMGSFSLLALFILFLLSGVIYGFLQGFSQDSTFLIVAAVLIGHLMASVVASPILFINRSRFSDH